MLKDTFTSLPSCPQALWEGIVLVQYEGIVFVQDESATNMIKKNRLVWKHCVQIQT